MGAFTSPGHVPKQDSKMGAGSRIDKGTSYATRRENFKAQWYNTKLERGHESGGTPAATQSTATAVHEFNQCSTALDHMIEDLTRGARLDNMCEASPVKEEQLRRQAELRRLRKHERESRDPHRKIEEKLK